MRLAERLERKKADIIKMWLELILKSYPPDTAQFYMGQSDPFANPVGTTTEKGLSKVFNEILGNMDRDAISAALDTIIRIRAIQNFSPSEAIAFIIELKKILRNALKKELKHSGQLTGLTQLENRIDQVLLIGFDIYMQCREKIYELKVSTERDKIYKAFNRAGLITEASEDEPGLKAS
jgi:hypothetical protein